MLIKKYTSEYKSKLFELIETEGEEWGEYWQEPHKLNYIQALENSITYVIFENEHLVGYARTLNDYIIWIVDLLVHQEYRGKEYGKFLMEHICAEFPDKGVYILGGNDVLPYYEKLGYTSEGIVYNIKS